MATELDRSALGVRYLLGELSEEEVQSFEKSYFADDRVFEDVQITEAEVIDAYVANELSGPSREFFERRLAASPRLRERVAFASTFAESAAARNLSHEETVSRGVGEDPWWRKLIPLPLAGARTPAWALAASMIVILGVIAVIVQSVRLRNESQRLAAERTELERQRGELERLSAEEHDRTASELREAQLAREQAEKLLVAAQQRPEETKIGTPTFAQIILSPGSLRGGGEVKELKLAPGISEVRLHLALPSVDYRTYRVTLSGPGDKEIQRKIQPTRSKTIVLRLPANLFTSGQYTVDVNGVTPADLEPVSNYTFRVVRK